MRKVKLFYPSGIENIWHHNADNTQRYRLDVIEKLVWLKDELIVDDKYEVTSVADPNVNLLGLAHAPDYLAALTTGKPKMLAESSGLIWQPNLIQVFANSAQALITASQGAMRSGRSGVISTGGHHAIATRGFGFNPVNEIAICASKLQADNPNLKIAVIDLDIHLGNGLQELLADKPNVILLDIWAKTIAKWGRPVSAQNIITSQVSTKQEYWEKLDIGIAAVQKFAPNLIIYHSGMDVWEGDRLGGITGFSKDDIVTRETRVFAAFPKGIVLVLGGGYVDRSRGNDQEKGMVQLIDLHKVSFEKLESVI